MQSRGKEKRGERARRFKKMKEMLRNMGGELEGKQIG